MKVLVIPDVHLKPWMFLRADEMMQKTGADCAVCLMDIPDDWDKQFDLDLYQQTFDAAIAFAEKYPQTRWCWGNHDLSYVWAFPETGFSSMALHLVCRKIRELQEVLPPENPIRYVQRIDDVIFCHGGVLEYFVDSHVPDWENRDIDDVLELINGLGEDAYWKDESPIWHRPQWSGGPLYQREKLLQVVGHTPMNGIERTGNVISCDVFSTEPDGTPIGTQEYLLLDTKTWEYQTVK